MNNYTLDAYQQDAARTAVILSQDKNVFYFTLGLTGEAGEVADKIKKVIRDERGIFTQASKAAIAKELGDCLWYCSMLADELGFSLSDIARINIQKLQERQKNGSIHGSGDDR